MARSTALLLALAASCGPATGPVPGSIGPGDAGFRERFSEATLSPGWVATLPNVAGANVRLEGGAMCLAMPAGSDGDVVVRHKFDVSRTRGQRLRLRARVRTEAPPPSVVRALLTVTTDEPLSSYGDTASTAALNTATWTDVHAVMDVAPNAASGELTLMMRGAGRAFIDDVEITVSASPRPFAAQLSAQQLANLVTFTRATALIRYFHPSDQAAALDWNEFFPAAIDRILQADSPDRLLTNLRSLFSAIAPTVTFSSAGKADSISSLPRSDGTHLARWRRYGPGTSLPYWTYREGREAENAFAISATRVHIENPQRCKKLAVRATGRKLAGTGKISLTATLLRPGIEAKELNETLLDAATEVVLTTELPEDTEEIELGVRIDGRSTMTLNKLTMTCDGAQARTIDLASSTWVLTGFSDLYTWEASKCDSADCRHFRRNPIGTDFSPEQDMLRRDIGNGLAIHVPLAVWANDTRTLPSVAHESLRNDFAINDLPLRLSVISAAWGTLSIFYPYFKDQRIDWLAVLPAALQEAAAARSPRQTHDALAHLVARLRDNHARASHPAAPTNGVLPVTLRRFGDKIVVTGGLPEFTSTAPVGSELLELDGVPAMQAYDRAAAQVSAATPGLSGYLAPVRMGMGAAGAFRRLKARGKDGALIERVVPLVPRDLYLHTNREVRPKPGTELAPGVVYVDFDLLPKDVWVGLMPALGGARAIVLDFRGFVNATALEMLSHLTSRAIRSPTWQIPRIPSVNDAEYISAHWDIRPRPPKLNAKIVILIDGRAMSSVETVLQMLRDSKLGTFVGETSGGTNGNVSSFQVPGGFEVRFTGMRAASEDGSTIQGHGITPDHIVHPTLDGVRAGRDEILEAGVTVAKGLIAP
jgi:Peptidase family S41